VAQERLQIRLDAVDNTKKAFNGLKGNTDSAKNALFNLKNAIIGLGVGLAIRSIIDVGKQIESLGLRFKFLFGSVQEGSKAFRTLVNYAGRVPFTLQQIQAGAGNLAVVTKNADELGKILEITGNVASVTGLDFQQTAEQIQRSFSGGIASADVFRERGVNALLGFKAGATVSIEETKKKFFEVFGKGGKFGQASNEFANTLEGTISMLQDKLFKFQTAIASGFFEELKNQFNKLNNVLEDSQSQIDKFGTDVGESVAKLIVNLAKSFKTLKEEIEIVKPVIGGLAVVFGGWITKLAGAVSLVDDYAKASEKLHQTVFDALWLEKLRPDPNALYDDTQILKSTRSLEGLVAGTAEYNAVLKLQEEETYAIIHAETEKQLALAKSTYEQQLLTEAVKEYQEAFKASFGGTLAGELQASLDKMKTAFDSIYLTISQGIVGGIKSLSEGIAEAIVLGKSLGEAFKNFVLKGIMSALAGIIQYYLTKLLLYVLEKLFGIVIEDQTTLEQKKLAILKKQTAELTKQMAIKAIMRFAFGFAEGGRVNGSRAEGGNVQGYRASGGQTSNGNAYMVGERGRELFIPSTDGQIVPNEKLGGMGATNINFTVQATDVKGVQELLIDNRATITNIINSALNQKGKPALV
jgi:hypothetical protein